MSAQVELSVDALALDVEDDAQGDRARAVVDEALRRLAERLARAPLGGAGARAVALDALELELGPEDDVLGPRAAERIADALYERLARRSS